MTAASPLVAALTPPYDADTETMLKKWMPPGDAMAPLELFRVLAKAPDLMASMRSLGSYFLGRQQLFPVRLREMMILRACAVAGCAYEWGVHVAAFATAAGLGAEEISALYEQGSAASHWTDAERAALKCCEESLTDHRLSAATRAALAAHFDEETRLALVVIAGWYGIIAMVANSCCTGPEPWAGGFPAA
ncbi:MAG: carboxymuconolactone decarboxylase family protein [Alphaproteobacteria bacterium]|nr:MAG: carboxymuconolactone decarboxylase family protein [Alphaproteobacteria bacterium]